MWSTFNLYNVSNQNDQANVTLFDTHRALHFPFPQGFVNNVEHPYYIVAETKKHRVWKISENGEVCGIGGKGVAGYRNGPCSESLFRRPMGVASLPNGLVYVADTGNHCIRRIDLETQHVDTLCGQPRAMGNSLGNWDHAMFNRPQGIMILDTERLLVADTGNDRVVLVHLSTRRVDLWAETLHAPVALRWAESQQIQVYFQGGRVQFTPQGQLLVETRQKFAPNPEKHVSVIDIRNSRNKRNLVFYETLSSHRKRLHVVMSTEPEETQRPTLSQILLQDHATKDVCFEVEFDRVWAHGCVLANASAYFRSLLSGDYAPTSVLRPPPNTSVMAFRVFLQFVYTGSIDFEDLRNDMDACLKQMIHLADFYQIRALCDRCMDYVLEKHLTPSNCVGWLEHVDHMSPERDRVMEYVLAHFAQVWTLHKAHWFEMHSPKTLWTILDTMTSL